MKKKSGIFIKIGIISSLSFIVTATVQRVLFWLSQRNLPKYEDTATYQWKEEEISYHIYGTGRPLLLLHNTALGASSKEWEKNIDEFSKIYQVYAIDLPGFGASQKGKTTYTTYQYALFLNAFIEDVVQRPASVIASSTSCCFALLARQLEAAQFQKLVLISPTGLEQAPFATEKENKKRILFQTPLLGTGLFLKAASKKSIKTMLEKELFFGKERVTKDLIASYYLAAHRGGEIARYTYASSHTKFMNMAVQQMIAHLPAPFLIVWGEENRNNPADNLEMLQKLRPDGAYILFEKTRQLPQYENPKKFNELVMNFLK